MGGPRFSTLHYCPRCGHVEQVSPITQAEMEVLQGYAQGLTTRAIAERRFVSVKTIASHRANLLLKTGTKTIAECMLWATRIGLLH